LHDLPGTVAGGRDAVDVAERDRERLLAEHVQPSLERGQHDLDMRPGRRRDQHRVETAGLDQRSPVRVRAWNMEARAHRVAHRLRRLRERGDQEAVLQLVQVREVLGLCDHAAPDHPGPQALVPLAGHVVRIMVRSPRSAQPAATDRAGRQVVNG